MDTFPCHELMPSLLPYYPVTKKRFEARYESIIIKAGDKQVTRRTCYAVTLISRCSKTRNNSCVAPLSTHISQTRTYH